MPKILEIARFTSPAQLQKQNDTNDTKETPIITKQQALNNTIEEALIKSKQPMTVTEVAELISRQLHKAYDEVTIRQSINQLVAQNKVSYRTETRAERAIRAGGKDLAVKSMCAKLYWAPVQEVPARTEMEAVPGFKLYGNETVHYKKYDTKYKTKRHSKAMEDQVELEDISTPTATPPSNELIDYLIEKMVAERVAEMNIAAVKALEEAQAELRRLKEFIKSNL